MFALYADEQRPKPGETVYLVREYSREGGEQVKAYATPRRHITTRRAVAQGWLSETMAGGAYAVGAYTVTATCAGNRIRCRRYEDRSTLDTENMFGEDFAFRHRW